VRLKESFGTAVKLFSRDTWGNISAYAKMLILTAAIFYEPHWSQTAAQPGNSLPIQQSATRVIDSILHR
jgi:hypothetical protein